MASYSFPGRYYILSLIICISFLCKCFALQQQHDAHTVPLASLFPASICSHSSSVHEKEEATLKVVHKHGPCSSSPAVQDHRKILRQDEARVKSIRSRLRSARAETQVERRGGSGGGGGGVKVPAVSGAVVGSGNYIVKVGLGAAKEELSMIFDTGSDVTWTQCKPCSKCYEQKEPLFDPSASASYSNISCTSTECSFLKSATGITPGCSSGTSTCIYGIQYGDKSFSVGYFARDTLTLTPSDVIPSFLFGCGKNNQGLFGAAAGLLGLGRNKVSFVEQTAAKYGRTFSYCLPATSSSSSGYVSFGAAARLAGSLVYTPLSALPSSLSDSFYAVSVAGISVGGKKLSFPAENFNSGGTIVDSGTVITRMPPTAYAALRAEFKKQMSAYPAAPALSILDTCFDLSGSETVSVPKVVFFFGGKAAVSLAAQGILYASRPTQVCLAFAANGEDGDVSIFGNVQQRTLKVVYDIGAGKIGFGAGGCS